jgi:hypothetical protein
LKNALGLPQLAKNNLREIYRSNGVTFKKVLGKRKFRPFETEATTVRDGRVFSNMAFHIKMAHQSNREIIMIDECVFSQRSYKQYAWAAVGCNVTASANWKSERAIAVLGAISSRRGLILWVHREKSMRGQDVEDFLGRLAALTDNIGDAVVLLDNATIHKTNAVR